VWSYVVVEDLLSLQNRGIHLLEVASNFLTVSNLTVHPFHLIVVHSSREMDFLDMLCALAVRVELFQVGFMEVLCSIGD